MTDDERFLSRWSRRKQGVKAPDEPVDAPPAAPAAPQGEDERGDDEILAEFGLPHPETLKPGDDVRGFMAEAVPERLRRLALRQLWRANPMLANLDGLVEYGEDYTDAATVVENLQTAYQVGRGMWRPVEAPESTESADELAAEPPEQEEAEHPIPEAEGAPRGDETAPDSREPIGEDPESLASAPDDGVPTRRRMVFHYEE